MKTHKWIEFNWPTINYLKITVSVFLAAVLHTWISLTKWAWMGVIRPPLESSLLGLHFWLWNHPIWAYIKGEPKWAKLHWMQLRVSIRPNFGSFNLSGPLDFLSDLGVKLKLWMSTFISKWNHVILTSEEKVMPFERHTAHAVQHQILSNFLN